MFSSMVSTRLRPGCGIVLAGAEHLAARVHGGVHAAGRAVQLGIEFFFQAAQPVVVHAHVAQHLRGNLVVGIEALELFLEVDALHVEGAHAGGHVGRDAARHPGKVVAVGQPVGDLRLRWSASSSGSAWTIAASVLRSGLLVVDLAGSA